VTLTATARPGATFAGWGGPCSGTGPCIVSAGDGPVTATFVGGTAVPTGPLVALLVSHGGRGAGTVSSSPAGISCGVTCQASFPVGTAVTLRAKAGKGSTFTGWKGACNGTASTCSVTLSSLANVIATFSKGATDRVTPLTVQRVHVTHAGRTATISFRVSLPAKARLRLLKGTRVVTGRTVSVRPGLRSVALRLPKAAHGRYTLQLRLKDVRGRTRTVTRVVHL
jgi:hypothetical protein